MEVRELLEMPADDWPIAFETVCETPEAVMAAVAKLDGELGDATVIERDGKRVGALISYEDFEGLLTLLWNREMELDLAALANPDRSEPTVPIEELMDQYGVSAGP